MRIHRPLAVLVALCSPGLPVPACATGTCTGRQADAAEAAADHLSSWREVASYETRFGPCDDGAMAEGSSEAVARLLVDRWWTLPELASAIRRQPRLEAFVLDHINSTLDTGDIRTIEQHAGRDCPAAASALCGAIKGAAAKALD